MLIERAQSALLLVDAQERLAPAMHDAASCLANCRLLLQAAGRLNVPIVVSEQYPKGLGHTVAELADLLQPEQVHAKRHFACSADPELAAVLERLDRRQLVICGMEAHVCVLQTALGLKAKGLAPAVAADAIASRRPESRDLALARMRANGVEIVTAEMVVFEWLHQAGTPEFKAVMPLIK